MMRISEAFPGQYLKSADLQGRQVKVTISHVEMEDVGGDTKPILYFVGKDRGIVLNKTNSNTLSEALGDETDQWRGSEVILYSTKVDFQGKRVDGLRVKFASAVRERTFAPAVREGTAAVGNIAPMRPAPTNYQEPGPGLAAELDDDIPF